MKLLAILAISLTTGVAFADVSIMENKKTVTIDCAKDKAVNLIGNNITVNLTGTCTKVTATGNHGTVNGSTTGAFVLGNHNTLNLDGVDTISIAGNYNTITYKKPLAKKKTTVSNNGKDNKVSGS
jgi:hypothetical protein